MIPENTRQRQGSARDLAALDVIAEVVRQRDVRAWLVGGSVRDRALGREAPDLDVVVSADARGLAQEVARRLRAPWFVLSDRHCAFRVVRPFGYVDIALLRGTDIKEDLSLRDFTINAVAVSIPNQEIVDPFEGLRHIRERRLVAVSESIFQDDPLRPMRAARFVHVLGFSLDPSLENLVRSQASLLAMAAPERIAAEAVLTLKEGRSPAALALWRDLGLLTQFLPESPAVAEPGFTEGVLTYLEDILAHPERWFPGQQDLLNERMQIPVDGSVERPVALRLAALLVGASPEQIALAAKRLRLSGNLTSLLARAGRFLGDRRWLEDLGKEVGRAASAPGRSVTLFFWECGPWEAEILVLAAACERADMGRAAEQLGLPALRWLLSVWALRAKEAKGLPVDGTMLMHEFKLSPGPLLGRLLRELRLAWEAGEIISAEEILEAARRYLERSQANRGA